MKKGLLDYFYGSLSRRPDKVVFEDSETNETLTLREMDELSAKVYRYLADQGIGTEDVVAIWLPRGVLIPAVMLGVIKAAAAYVVIGSQAGEDVARFFIEDSHAKLTVTPDVLDEISALEPLYGYKEASPDDLACIVYSSGSSGYFKGSMQEYGQYDKVIAYMKHLVKVHRFSDLYVCRCSAVQGFYGMVGVLNVVSGIMGMYNDIISYDLLRDPVRFKKELIDKKINQTTLSPMHIKNGDWLDGTYLKYAMVIFETFGGVYSDKLPLLNRYGLTEYFSAICEFVIDKPYDITPVGRPIPSVEMYLADENGQKVRDGEIGEIYVKSQHFRGYINRPEETAKTLVDGYIRTGDMAVLEDGQYVVLGRKMDLLKTDEGYIVPCKIAVAVKKTTGLSWCYVKCFEHSPAPVVCLYYTDDVELDLDNLKEKLSAYLPAYMLPTHAVKLDDVNHFTSGKTNRFSFKNPVEG